MDHLFTETYFQWRSKFEWRWFFAYLSYPWSQSFITNDNKFQQYPFYSYNRFFPVQQKNGEIISQN